MLLPARVNLKKSVKALAKSFNVNHEEIRQGLSSFFGKHWEPLVLSCGPKDTLNDQERAAINNNLAEHWANHYEIPCRKALIETFQLAGPFSHKPVARRFVLDQPSDGPDTVDIGAIFDQVSESDLEQDFMEALEEAGIDTSKFDGMNDFMERLRISKPVEPDYYYDALTQLLGWDVTQQLSKNEVFEPALSYKDAAGDWHPIFLNAISASPGDSGDCTFLNLLADLEEEFDVGYEHAVLLTGAGLHRETKGDTFCVIGVWHDGECWCWLFLNDLPPQEQVSLYPYGKVGDLSNSLESPVPPRDLALKFTKGEAPLQVTYACMVHPIEEPKQFDGKRQYKFGSPGMVSTNSGWNIFMYRHPSFDRPV